MTRLLRRLRHEEGDRGSISPAVAIIATTLLLMVSLVYDGATKLRASADATSIASESARAGAQELTGAAIIGQPSPVAASRGAAAAHSYLSQVGASGTVSISGTTVTVTVSKTWSPKFTGLFTSETVTGSASVSSIRTIGGVEP